MSFWKKLFSSSTEEENKEDTPTDSEKTAESSSDGANTENAPSDGDKTAESSSDGANTEDAPTDGDKTEDSSSDGANTEDAPTDDDKTAESSSNDANTEDAPTDGDKTAESSSDGANTEDAPTDDDKTAESSSDGANTEKSSPEPPEPWLFQVIHKITRHKVFSEFVMFLLLVIAGYITFLSYGQITKREGSVSFETVFSHNKMEQICNTFLYGDMEKLVSYIYIERPIENYSKSNEDKLRKHTAKRLEKEFFQLFKGRDLQLTRLDCEYKKIEQKKETRFICDCYFKISETEQFILTLERIKKDQFLFSLTMEKKKEDTTFQKMNALFDYITNGYESENNYKLAEYLTDKEKSDYYAAASYFTMNTEKNKRNDTYIEHIASRFKNLNNLQIRINEVFFSPYTYDNKEKIKRSNLIIHFSDLQTGTNGILCQPVLIDLYGYQPEQKSALCSDGLRFEVSKAMKNLFSY